jgi:hypothetical protein
MDNIMKERFFDMLKNMKKIAGKLGKKAEQIAIIVCMAVAVALSFPSYTGNGWLWFKTKVTIMPTLMSLVPAILLYLSIIVRFRLKILGDSKKFPLLELMVTLLNVWFCASFLSVFLSTKNFVLIPISPQALMWGAIVLSWISMRTIAGFIWIALFVFSLFRFSSISEAMGGWGALYILSAFAGMLLQLRRMESPREILLSLKEDFLGVASRAKDDASISAEVAKATAKKIVTPGTPGKI